AAGWMIDRPATAPADPMWGFALTPELAQTFSTWRPPTAAPVNRRDSFALAPVGLLALAALFVLWRGRAAATIIAWREWLGRWRRAPVVVQLVGWVALAGIYFVAVWPPLVVLCWLVAAFLMAAQPLVGLGIAAALIPFYFQHKEVSLVDATLTVPPAMILLFCLIPPIIGRIDWRRPMYLVRRCSALDWLALSWLAISLLSMANVWHWPAYWRGLMTGVLAPLVGYAAVRTLVATPLAQHRIMAALFGGGLFVAGFGLVDWTQGGGTLADGVLRLVGPYYSPNHTALYLVRTLFVGIGLALAAQDRQRILWVVGCGAVTVALLLTASRGAWLLGMPAGCGLLVWAWLRQRRGSRPGEQLIPRRPRARWLHPYATVFVGIGGIAALLSASWNRLANSETVFSRLRIWQATLQLWAEEPWFGVGPAGFFWRYPAYVRPPIIEPNLIHSHNVWLEAAAIWGLLGLFWMILLGFLAIRMAGKVQRNDLPSFWMAFGLLAALAAALAHAQVDAFWSLPDLAAWNWLALGLAVGNGEWTVGSRE
ncbi:MAG: hypothetical protein DCC55_27855, partial [Chloroflexi bacterium]